MEQVERSGRRWVNKLVKGSGLILYLAATLLMLFMLWWHYRLLAGLRQRIDEMARSADIAMQAQDVLSTERAMVGQINYAFTFRDIKMMRSGVAQSLPNFKASYLYLVVLEGGADPQLQHEMERLVDETVQLRDLAIRGQWDEAEQVRDAMIPLISAFESRLEAKALSRRYASSRLQKEFGLYTTRSLESFLIFVLMLIGMSIVNIVILHQRGKGGLDLISRAVESVTHGRFDVQVQVPPLLKGDPLVEHVARSIENVTRTLAQRFAELEQRAGEAQEALEQLLQMLEESTQLACISPEEQGDLSHLYAYVVEALARQFQLFHIALYTLDETGEFLVLRAASSERGKAMLREHYHVRMGEGVIGYVARHREPYIGGKGNEILSLQDEQFPETAAYMVLPLVARGKALGALELRCSRVSAFPRHIILVMETIAQRMALLLENVRLYREVERYRRELNRLYGEMLAETWRAVLSGVEMLGYRYLDERGIEPVRTWTPAMEEALERDGMVRRWIDEETEIVAVPLHARGLRVGGVAAQRQGGWTPQWLETFLQLVEHLETALESALLFTESQMRAMRERALGELSAQFAQAFDMQVLLENAVRELGRRFELDDVSIFIGPPDEEEAIEEEEVHDGEA